MDVQDEHNLTYWEAHIATRVIFAIPLGVVTVSAPDSLKCVLQRDTASQLFIVVYRWEFQHRIVV